MKRLVYLLLAGFILVAGLAFALRPFIVFSARRQLGKVFAGSAVSIRTCRLSPLHQISLLDVELQRPRYYDIKVGKLTIRYGLLGLLKGSILKVSLVDVAVQVNLPRESILDMNRYVHLPQGSPGAFSIRAVELVRADLDLRFKELNLKASVSAEADPAGPMIHFLDMKVPAGKGRNFLLEDGSLKINRQGLGELFIKKIRYDKFRIGDISAVVRLEGNDLSLDPLSARALNGRIEATAGLTIDPNPAYHAELKVIDLDLAALVHDLELKERFQMSGMLAGQLTVDARGFNVNILSGHFSTAQAGGVLVITNEALLENIARSSKLPLDIVGESFRNYRYNTGTIRLSLDQGNLVLDMAFDGETGKRHINITLHDFSITKGGI